MGYRKFLVLFLILLAIPIVKADGCGIVCPKGANDLLTFSLATLCNFFTWSFCHIFAFIIVAISGIVIFIFWHQQKDEKKKTIKLFLFALFGIFALILLYPYIKAWTGAAVSVANPCSVDTWHSQTETSCVLNCDVSPLESHNPNNAYGHCDTEYCIVTINCGSDSDCSYGLISNSSITINPYIGTVPDETILLVSMTSLPINASYDIGFNYCIPA